MKDMLALIGSSANGSNANEVEPIFIEVASAVGGERDDSRGDGDSLDEPCEAMAGVEGCGTDRQVN